MISKNTRASSALQRSARSHKAHGAPANSWAPPQYYVTQEGRPLASIVSGLTLPKLHLATFN